MNEKEEKKLLKLAGTMLEAVEHLKKRLAEGKVENNLYLFTDMMEAFALIEEIIYKKENMSIENMTEDLKKSFAVIISFYEEENYNEIRSYFNFVFLPAFQTWYQKLNDNYNQIN
ncbi:hypothetical protein [Natronospora cellulosivora (SeqCode)]